MLVGLLNALRHVAACRQTASLNRALAQQVEALRAERERTHLVIDEARDPYVELDRDGRILVWNGPAEAVFGWTGDQVLGRPISRHRARGQPGGLPPADGRVRRDR